MKAYLGISMDIQEYNQELFNELQQNGHSETGAVYCRRILPSTHYVIGFASVIWTNTSQYLGANITKKAKFNYQDEIDAA